jgi:uncharacterized protein (TIGR03435 family)
MFTPITRAFILITSALLAASLIAQSPNTFEVASIRLANPNSAAGPGGRGTAKGKGGGALQSDLGNGRFTISAIVYNLITKAFGRPNCLAAMSGEDCPYVTGGPAWNKSDIYEIRATLPDGTPPYNFQDYLEGRSREVYTMLEALLRDRFQLKVHHESREVPVFILSVARNGHKMKLTPDDKKTFQTPDGVTRVRGGFLFNATSGPNNTHNLQLHVENTSMDLAAETLSNLLNRPVLNRTGLQGTFDFEMEYAPDTDLGRNARPGAELAGSELFSALQQQAGLRLESAKEKIDVLVIDSIERPSEN